MFGHRHPAILGRVEMDEFIIDLRTVGDDQEDKIFQAFREVAGGQ